MAEVFKSVIGKLSGTLGNMVFRNIGDKVVVYMRPHNQQISYSEDSVKNRGKFGLTSLLAKNARLLPGIKDAWDSSSAEGRSAYTKLIKANAKSSLGDRLTVRNVITPMGNGLTVKSFTLTEQKFAIEYKFSERERRSISVPYNANLLIFYYDAKNPLNERKNFIAYATMVVNEEGSDEYTNLEMKLNQAYANLIPMYSKAVLFFAITKVENKEVQWTTNFKAEVDLV